MRSLVVVFIIAFSGLIACGGDEGSGADAVHQVDAVQGPDTVDVAVADLAPLDSVDVAADAPSDVEPVDPRQELRDRSLYENISFEEADGDGAPVGWKCAWFGDGPEPQKLCEVVAGDAVHGDHALRIAPGVVIFQDEHEIDASAHVLFDLFASAGSQAPAAGAFYQFGAKNTEEAWDVMWTQYAKQVNPTEGGWYGVRSLTQPMEDLDFIRLCISNADGNQDLYVDDLVVLEESAPLAAAGHLLRAEHYGRFTLTAGTEDAVLWIPLPMNHGHQVPLFIGLEVEPEGLADDVSYNLDEYGNFGAEIRFGPESHAVGAVLRYDAVVMVLEADEAGLAELYTAQADPEIWLADTPVVHWGHDGISQAALDAVEGIDEPTARMEALLEVSSQAIYLQGMPDGLDAVNAFESHMGSCTSFANLGAALGRAADMPTRTIANYLVGMPQQTHSINEFYLGPELGWRLVEPQSTAPSVPADYAVLVRIDLPDPDEGEAAMASSQWSYPGVPLLSLMRPVEGGQRLQSMIMSDHFPGCDSCDNMASYQATLFGDAAEVFEQACAAWQQTLAAWTTTGPEPAEQVVRSDFLNVDSLDGVKELLAEITAARQ